MATKFLLDTSSQPSASFDAWIVFVPAGDFSSEPAFADLDGKLNGALSEHAKKAEFKGEVGSALVLPLLGRGPSAYAIVAGLGSGAVGEKAARTVYMEALAGALRQAQGVKAKSVGVRVPRGADLEASALGVALGAYKFDKYFAVVEARRNTIEKVVVSAPGRSAAADSRAFALGLSIAEGVCLARDLVNEPPNVLYPETFAERARQVAKKNHLECKILDPKGIVKAGMNLHAAVGLGSARGPYFIHLTHKPKNPKGRIAFVGKGLTFDSGGLCIKPMQGMADMKSDMAGGAAVLGLMSVMAALAPDLEVHGIIGAAENMPDGSAYRPADVIFSLAGKGVEIINTDAEGRLVLADALTYAARLDPDFIVDAATLTGATMISLGSPYSAYFTNREEIAVAMKSAAADAGESFWRMPLIEELKSQLDSSVTDLKHTGDRYGGAITAALFLREFTLGVPWMHWDVPGATYRDDASGLHPKGGTGHGVLTFLELIRAHSRAPIIEREKKESVAKTAKKTVKKEVEPRKLATLGGRAPKGPRKATPRRP